MKALLTVLALGLLTTSLAHARLPVNETLEETVTEKFFADGNNSETNFGQAIQQILGRKLSRSDFQVLTLSTQTMRNPWAFAYAHNPTTCRAGDNSSEFLILLRVKVKNANASTFATYSFKVSAEQALLASRSDKAIIDNCTDVSENDGNFVIAPAYNLVGNFVYVEIAEPKEAQAE